nr:phage major capsid protein [Bradyrhizobium sp. 166]
MLNPHARSRTSSTPSREGLDQFQKFVGSVDDLSSSVKLLRSVVDGRRRDRRSAEERVRRIGRWVQAEIGSDDARAWCSSEGLTVNRAQGTGTNAAGGALVPDEIADAIIALRDTRGAFRAAAGPMRMRSDTKHAPRRLTGLTASFATENLSLAEQTMTWDSVRLVAKKILVLARFSAELVEDAAIDVGLAFLQEVAYAFADKEDLCGFYGNGTSTYGGIKGLFTYLTDGAHAASVVTASANTFATLTMTDLSSLMGAVPANAVPGARWFVSQRGYGLAFCRLAGAGGGIITRYINGVLTPTFMGFPVQLTQVMPQVVTSLSGQVMIAFGDLSLAATLGDRRDVRVRFSVDRFMDSDQIGALGTQRFDINVHDVGDATTAGPVAGLIGL